MEEIDVAIIGGGPAGLQAALVLARTRKNVIVFDAPVLPRNAASHGVHNFVGLDGLLPSEIRDRAWTQINQYQSARHVLERVDAITRADGSADLLVHTATTTWRARHVVVVCGYHDKLPDLEGFEECWGNTIIPCPFCDGYENRDRVWGIVPATAHKIDVLPAMVQNWTSDRVVIVPNSVDVTDQQSQMLDDLGIAVHVGDIVALEHESGQLLNVTIDSGHTIEIGTLLFTPEEETAPLITQLVDTLGLDLDGNGYVTVNETQQTNVNRLWAAGDVQGMMGGIGSANAGGAAAFNIARDWHTSPTLATAPSGQANERCRSGGYPEMRGGTS